MKGLILIAVLAGLPVAGAYADCSYPAPPDKIPDGNTATLEEMVSGQKAVKEYNQSITAYLACIKLEHDGAVSKINPGQKPTAEQKKALDDLERIQVQKNNAAVDQLQSVADRFNEQVKLYKARTDKSKS